MNCANYAYARRGYACSPVTSAQTSNEKFITPCDEVYYQPFTHMLQYPGYSGDFVTTVGTAEHPEEIKTYFGKSYDTSKARGAGGEEKESHASLPDPIESGCPRCKKLQKN